MAIRSVERSGRSLRVVIDDVLTPEDAVRIKKLIRRQPAGAQVTVDVRAARSCPAHALLMIASLQPAAGSPLQFVGLTVESRRMLRYLSSEPRASGGLEESQG